MDGASVIHQVNRDSTLAPVLSLGLTTQQKAQETVGPTVTHLGPADLQVYLRKEVSAHFKIRFSFLLLICMI